MTGKRETKKKKERKEKNNQILEIKGKKYTMGSHCRDNWIKA